MWIAITREVSTCINDCELTHLQRQKIDLPKARLQHRQYEQALVNLGCQVVSLPEAPSLPDAVFVEDTAVVFDELAIITRPGAASRQAETRSISETLAGFRKLVHLQHPATLDGGDVLRVGKQVFIGVTPRTNQSGIEQVRQIMSQYGYTIKSVSVQGCLHLKSGITQVGDNLLLVNSTWINQSDFPGFDFVEVYPGEPYAGNALFLNRSVVFPVEYPYTRNRMEQRGISIVPVEASELSKAEGGVTCCSLVFQDLSDQKFD